jgi:hypothetical protein
MTDAEFWSRVLLGCLIIWATAVLVGLALCKAAAKTPPMPHLEDLWDGFDGGPLPTLADRMDAARGWDPVAAAETITEEAAR